MQLRKYITFFVTILITFTFLSINTRKAESKKSKLTKGKSRNGNSTDSASNSNSTISNSTISNSTNSNNSDIKCNAKKSSPVSNIYSHIIMSRLYAYENKIHPLLMNLNIIPKTEKIILNVNILQEITNAIGSQMEKTDCKKLLQSFDGGIISFFIDLKAYGNFTVDGSSFKFTLHNPKKSEPKTCNNVARNITINTNEDSTNAATESANPNNTITKTNETIDVNQTNAGNKSQDNDSPSIWNTIKLEVSSFAHKILG